MNKIIISLFLGCFLQLCYANIQYCIIKTKSKNGDSFEIQGKEKNKVIAKWNYSEEELDNIVNEWLKRELTLSNVREADSYRSLFWSACTDHGVSNVIWTISDWLEKKAEFDILHCKKETTPLESFDESIETPVIYNRINPLVEGKSGGDLTYYLDKNQNALTPKALSKMAKNGATKARSLEICREYENYLIELLNGKEVVCAPDETVKMVGFRTLLDDLPVGEKSFVIYEKKDIYGRKKDILFVEFIGTKSLYDGVKNTQAFTECFSEEGHKCIKVHSGFLKIFKQAIKCIDFYNPNIFNEHQKIIVKGFSMGGAVAILMGTYIKLTHPDAIVNVVAFAPPNGVDKNSVEEIEKILGKENIISFKADGDMLANNFKIGSLKTPGIVFTMKAEGFFLNRHNSTRTTARTFLDLGNHFGSSERFNMVKDGLGDYAKLVCTNPTFGKTKKFEFKIPWLPVKPNN